MGIIVGKKSRHKFMGILLKGVGGKRKGSNSEWLHMNYFFLIFFCVKTVDLIGLTKNLFDE